MIVTQPTLRCNYSGCDEVLVLPSGFAGYADNRRIEKLRDMAAELGWGKKITGIDYCPTHARLIEDQETARAMTVPQWRELLKMNSYEAGRAWGGMMTHHERKNFMRGVSDAIRDSRRT